jgi:hypothetical protein
MLIIILYPFFLKAGDSFGGPGVTGAILSAGKLADHFLGVKAEL